MGGKYIDRNEFSRDRDRILYTNAFRRLQHKAQVYSNKKGDHYRTRLTHTLEVNQIAKSISKNLGLNIDLTDEDKTYLRLKWGKTYKHEEWVKLE